MKRVLTFFVTTMGMIAAISAVTGAKASAIYLAPNTNHVVHHDNCTVNFVHGNLGGGAFARVDITQSCNEYTGTSVTGYKNGAWIHAGPCRILTPIFTAPNGSGCDKLYSPFGYATAYAKGAGLMGSSLHICSVLSCRTFNYTPFIP